MNKFVSFLIVVLLAISIGLFFTLRKTNADNEVVFWTLQMGNFAPYINGVIEDFEKENPDIKIKWVDVPFSEGEKRTLASVLSDNPPDLVNLNPDFSATLASKGALWEIPQENINQYNDEIINSLKTKDGKLYSIPWYATSAVTIYNKELLKRANVPVPKTYDEVANYAKNLRGINSYIIYPNITENDTMLKILKKYGITELNSEKSVKVFEMYKELYKKDFIPAGSITVTLQESLEKYMSENVAIIEAGANFLNMIKENAPSVYSKTDVSYQLKGSKGQYNFSLMNFVIPLKSAHQEEALKFALFLTNEKNQLELAKLTNILAVNKNTLKDGYYTSYKANDLMAKARVISAEQLNYLNPVYKTQKNQKDINNLVNQAIQNILLNKGETKKILDELDKNVKLFDR